MLICNVGVGMSRFSEIYGSLPPSTCVFVALCSGLFVVQNVSHLPLQSVTMCPRNVIHLHEYYRVETSALFHGGIMHIAMNLASTLALSPLLERKLGTLRHLLSVLWTIQLAGVVYLVVAYVAATVFAYGRLMDQHSVGFSGVLFYMLVLEANLSGAAGSRSLLGIATVPSWMYPWALLVLLQFIMPNLSLLGHISGVLAGYMDLYGIYDLLILPEEATLRAMEQWRIWRLLVRAPNFVPSPSTHIVPRAPPAIGHSIRSGVALVKHYTEYWLGTIWTAVFGRGADANANILIGQSPTRALIHDEDDDDHVWASLTPTGADKDQGSELV